MEIIVFLFLLAAFLLQPLLIILGFVPLDSVPRWRAWVALGLGEGVILLLTFVTFRVIDPGAPGMSLALFPPFMEEVFWGTVLAGGQMGARILADIVLVFWPEQRAWVGLDELDE